MLIYHNYWLTSMKHNVFRLIDTFSDQKVLVIGEAMLDTYLKGTSERLCREAPVPVVDVIEREDFPGGAANTALNTTALGAQVIFVSVTGDDLEGRTLRSTLEEHNVPTTSIVVEAGRATLSKQRLLAEGQLLARIDQGSTGPISQKTEEDLIGLLYMQVSDVDAIIISDYDYGVLTPGVIKAIAELQKLYEKVIVADARRLSRYEHVGLTAVKPNYREALDLLSLNQVGSSEARASQIVAYGEQILNITNSHIAAVTLDEDGAVIFERSRPLYRTYARRAPNHRAAGAGDTFVSAFTLAIAGGAETATAAEIASAAAALVVEKAGTATCSIDELTSFFYEEIKVIDDAFLMAARVASYRRQGKKIVFTNGCFDILHSGHVAFLNQAKSYGDILIVGINSDESVRRLKGSHRPINPLEDRAQVLAALSCVDHIIPFASTTPKDLIRAIAPDIFVKGGDYTIEKLPEASLVIELGGVVRILPYVDDHSTSGIIDRIRRMNIHVE